ncbi:hypothetical protein BT96DRAFT_1007848 [Gymnopus androsaceus JB14]|uniref:Uncharacterized protein n=1 Tax=Gymnopus androsaceus JB14 TaxID=1447944 RepID=A0A6A4GH00_9AGAR|nr:hypothetical protein BT96DRAFT_1007848 [Gymnopus androsaceus JB14]
MAFRILHNAVIGKMGIEGREYQAFLSGFRLPVPGGLSFPEIAHSYLCGAGAFVGKAYNFIESFDDLSSKLQINLENLDPVDEARLSGVLESAPESYHGKSFEFILQDFLEGRGIPCPTFFETIREQISPLIQLSEAEDSSTFCLRIFTWAIGGAPYLQAGTLTIMEVFLVSDNNWAYIPKQQDEPCRAEFLHTEYALTELGTYGPHTEAKDAREAIHFWLFHQILEAIGSHTFI